MRKLFGAAAVVISSMLTACGGGGGSPGEIKLPYSISLRAAKTQLPINISNQRASIGAYARYTTTLYVEAREGSAPIPGGEDIFACAVVQGLDSGVLYYLDGDDKHEDDDGNPLAYRSVTLGSNSGSNSFHFHAGDQSGTARITCSVTNPNDKRTHSASVDIVVGGATGKPASVIAAIQVPQYLGSRDNTELIRNNVGIQAFLTDDANQPIPDPSAANLQVSIRTSGFASDASAGARLLSGAQSGSVIQARTIGGVGLISLSSGPKRGVILLEFTTDRFDNNVSNGIQDPVTSLKTVSVVDAVAKTPLAFSGGDSITATNGLNFFTSLSAEGGVPPYSWSVVGALPTGLTLDDQGILRGTPKVAPGDYGVVLRVTDSTGAMISRNTNINIKGALIEPLVFDLTGCTGDVNTACPLPDAPVLQSFVYAFSASGADATKDIKWTYTNIPEWLENTATTGSTGIIGGTPKLADCGVHRFIVTGLQDTLSVSRQVSINVVSSATVICP